MNKVKSFAIVSIFIMIIASVFSFIYLTNLKPEIKITEKVPLADETNATAESVISLINSLNDFSFNFYKHISLSEEDNIFFSPYSIFVALSMAYEGAKENTSYEMQNVLNVLQNDSVTLGTFGKVYNLLNQNQRGYTISTANAFWAHKDYRFLKDYLYLLKNYYMAEANELDFAKNVEAAETINNWIEEKTHDKIKDMIDASMLSEMTKLVLTNAIYFKGFWANPFDPDNTFENDFELLSKNTVNVEMMSQESDFNYTETDDLQILELDYAGNDLSMIVVLPKENNISVAESAINIQNLSNWKNDFYQLEINVEIPKFKFEKKYILNDLLKEMGIIDAFLPGVADFSGMDGTRYLYLGTALHQSFIDVNEEGTEAAAATAIVMEATAIPEYKEFIADHPFIFLIQHKETGAILFMGKVLDPSN